MKTTVSIDQDLVTEALTETGLVSQEEVITLGLQTLIQLKRQARIKEFKGRLPWDGDLWDGDLDASRATQ
jgi:Arc/MetJ family transcription regulator